MRKRTHLDLLCSALGPKIAKLRRDFRAFYSDIDEKTRKFDKTAQNCASSPHDP